MNYRLKSLTLCALIGLAPIVMASENGFSEVEKTTLESHDVIFPNVKKSYLKQAMRYEATDILQLDIGLDKNQIRHILGNPHFNDGLFNVNTWHYLVNIRNPEKNTYLNCQLRINFDKTELADSYSWKGDECTAENFKKLETPVEYMKE